MQPIQPSIISLPGIRLLMKTDASLPLKPSTANSYSTRDKDSWTTPPPMLPRCLAWCCFRFHACNFIFGECMSVEVLSCSEDTVSLGSYLTLTIFLAPFLQWCLSTGVGEYATDVSYVGKHSQTFAVCTLAACPLHKETFRMKSGCCPGYRDANLENSLIHPRAYDLPQ